MQAQNICNAWNNAGAVGISSFAPVANNWEDVQGNTCKCLG